MTEVRYVREHLKKGIGPTRTDFDPGWHLNFNNDAIRKVHSWELDRMLKFTCNVVFYYRHFPFIWRCATIGPLEKGSMLHHWDVDAYRGISHVHQGEKFIEVLIFYRMRYVVGDGISDYQSGGVLGVELCNSLFALLKISRFF